MKININDDIKIKLTKSGRKVVKENAQVFNIGAGKKIVSEKWPVDKEGYSGVQLWVLMKEFGSKCWLGNPDFPYFENNEIVLIETKNARKGASSKGKQ